ncbi:MAG: DUF3786 domain-containing protein [Bacillota bacterium]|nr:DUF3786 domain-containing protein [Bacillota bacterium]
MKQDNYAEVVKYDKKRFLQRDPLKMAANTRLKIQGDEIIAPLFNREFKVNIHTGDITAPNGEKPTSYQQMFIYHHLIEAKEGAELKGEYVTIAGIKDAWVHQRAFENAGTRPLAGEFSGRPQDFKKAGDILGAESISGGDGAFILKALPMIPLKIIFWDGEEGIPAAANILFDPSITDFTHPEDVIGLGEAAADLLIEQGKLLHEDSAGSKNIF